MAACQDHHREAQAAQEAKEAQEAQAALSAEDWCDCLSPRGCRCARPTLCCAEATASGTDLLVRRALAQVLLEQKYPSAMEVVNKMDKTEGLPANYGVNHSKENS